MKEIQLQNRVRRSSFMPDEDGEQNNSGSNERRLHRSDVSFTEIDEGPHQTTAAGAGEQSADVIESAVALPNALVHSGDHQESGDNGDRHVDQENPAP